MHTALEDAALLGVTVTVAAGDNGSSDGGTHIDFPASSPYALACGGTTLITAGGDTISSETVWNDTALGAGATGGGISSEFLVPEAATAAVPSAPDGVAGRGVPDVARR
jgi:kumamolisin